VITRHLRAWLEAQYRRLDTLILQSYTEITIKDTNVFTVMHLLREAIQEMKKDGTLVAASL